MVIALICVVSSLEDSFDDVSTARIHFQRNRKFLNPKKVMFRVLYVQKTCRSTDTWKT